MPPKQCSVKGCQKQVQLGFNGMCIAHGRKAGITTPSNPRCRVEGCKKYAQYGFNGMCVAHGREVGITTILSGSWCSVKRCEKQAVHGFNGMCAAHGQAQREYDQLLEGVEGNVFEKVAHIADQLPQYTPEELVTMITTLIRLPIEDRKRLNLGKYKKGT